MKAAIFGQKCRKVIKIWGIKNEWAIGYYAIGFKKYLEIIGARDREWTDSWMHEGKKTTS